MTGRNNKPDGDGKVASPSRLDQFGEKLAEDTEMESINKAKKNDNQTRK
jgi:hypothetical protein